MKRRISAALLTLCMLMSLIPSVAFAAPNGTFDDVNDHWGKGAIERWAGYGVVNGDGTGNFAPDKQMTRAEFATMLANMLGYKTKAANTFLDVNDSDWFADAILKLAAAGVIQGSNGMANPNAPISRQEAAVMMCRAFNIPTTGGSLNFADSADVADWAKGAVAALAQRGMLNGVGGNNVAPLANINRASVATLLDNMITEYVTEDKTISGTVNGIVLVAADANVTVQDATLSENLIVAPKADGAEVTLTGSTTAGDVYVDAAATVKVDSNASAGEVQVGAANSTVDVAGKADTITVDSTANNTAVNVNEGAAVGDVAVNAADSKVNVAKDATVDTVAVSGANADVQVSGKVDNVTVAAGATGTDITANSGATVGKVETSADDVTVSGSGKVENVTANDGTVSVTTPGTNVENKTDSADNVIANGKPVPPESGGTVTPPPSGGGSSGGGSSVTTEDVTSKTGIIGVDPVDQAKDDGKITDMPAVTAKVEKKSNSDTLTVKLTTGAKTNGSVTAVPLHESADARSGYWVGVAIPLPALNSDADGSENGNNGDGEDVQSRTNGSGYYYYFGPTAYTTGNLTALTAEPVPSENTTKPDENTSYGVFWIDAGAVTPKTHIAIGTSAEDKNPTKYVVDLSGVKLAGTQEKATGALHDRSEYASAYKDLGMSFTNSNGVGTLTVNEADLLPRVFDEKYAVAHKGGKMSDSSKGTAQATDIFAGVQFEIPKDATKLDITITGYGNTPYHETGNVPKDTTTGFGSLAGLDVYKSERENSKLYLIDYVPVWDGETGKTVSYSAPLTYRMVWTCGTGDTVTTKVQTYTLNVNSVDLTGAEELKYVVNKVDNKVDIREDGDNQYICFQIAKTLNNDSVAENGLFPIKEGAVVAAAKVVDGKIVPYKTWVTGGKAPTDYKYKLELPAKNMTNETEDYNHHVGLTLKMDANAVNDVTWYFWTEDSNSLKAYTVTIKADDLKPSTHDSNSNKEEEGTSSNNDSAGVTTDTEESDENTETV